MFKSTQGRVSTIETLTLECAQDWKARRKSRANKVAQQWTRGWFFIILTCYFLWSILTSSANFSTWSWMAIWKEFLGLRYDSLYMNFNGEHAQQRATLPRKLHGIRSLFNIKCQINYFFLVFFAKLYLHNCF